MFRSVPFASLASLSSFKSVLHVKHEQHSKCVSSGPTIETLTLLIYNWAFFKRYFGELGDKSNNILNDDVLTL